VASSPSLNQRIALYSLFLKVFFFAVDIRIHSKLSIKTAAIPCSRLRRLYPPAYSFSSIGSLIVPSTTHRMLSHLALALSHSRTPYKLERRSSKLYKTATTVG
jgi:hypothetical protein